MSSEAKPTEVALTISSAAASCLATSAGGVGGQRREGDDVGDPASGAIDDGDVGGAGVVEGGDDAARGRSGAEHGDVHAAHVDAVGVEGADEALPVGAVADEAPVVADDGVDRAQGGGGGSEAVDRAGDLLLVRRRHREPGDAEQAHRRQRLVGASGRHVEGDVAPVQPGGVERSLVDDRRQRVADRRADQRRDVHAAHATRPVAG